MIWNLSAAQIPARCEHCGGEFLVGDVAARWRETGEGRHRWAHVACTRDGMERWCRANRPHNHPLNWDRSELPGWSASGTSRALILVHPDRPQRATGRASFSSQRREAVVEGVTS